MILIQFLVVGSSGKCHAYLQLNQYLVGISFIFPRYDMGHEAWQLLVEGESHATACGRRIAGGQLDEVRSGDREIL